MKNRSVLICVILLCACIYKVQANGITVQKVAISDTNRAAKTAMIRFNISWENSWRDSINWDAAWIFIKFREPKDSVWQYRHLTMSQTGNQTGTGNTSMKFAVSADNKGVFYYRQGIGSGKVAMDSVKLLWNYGNDNVQVIDSVEVKVFATEMVYVPSGNFCLGDGNGTSRSNNSFQLKNAPNNYVVITDKWSPLINTKTSNTSYYGNDDAVLYTDGIRISGLGGIDITNDKTAEYPDFPTGYQSFYCMKYDVTQGQYADFLNTLSLRDSSINTYVDTSRLKSINKKYKLALQNLDPLFYSIPLDLQRHTIVLDSIEKKYTVSRPDRAYGKGSSNAYLSFSDWAALRPISELEYEKAARGPLPPTYKSPKSYYYSSNSDTTNNWTGFDWAWGNDTTLARANTGPINSNSYGVLNFSGLENGTESFNNYNIYKRYINPIYSSSGLSKTVSGGDGGDGPFRVGIFATDSSNRISSGATYYGIMDFSKNVSQIVVGVGQLIGRTLSYKKNGDGLLNLYGSSDNTEFFSSANNGIGPNSTYINKTGPISERQTGGSFIGFRSVRSAPLDN